MSKNAPEPFAPVVLKLLQGVIDFTDPHWGTLLEYQALISDYVQQIGLALYVQETDGYAYLFQPELKDERDRPIGLPRLTKRYRLSYETTLLLVLLRERLDRFEIENPEADHLIVTNEDMWALVEAFLPERSNEQLLRRRVDASINKLESDLGVLKTRKEGGFIVQKVIKARLPSDTLLEIRDKLYAQRDEIGQLTSPEDE